ncbi:MAG TPA: HAMP domain-containing sensor histidine kinase [Acidimicrobiia bacterium]|nr:HAMP domain-containing sensor histidine kinase [Acidimicrobiia bacterium]
MSLATTSLVVIALLIPLALLVSRQAADAARIQAERDAQGLASVIGLALTLEIPFEDLEGLIGPLDDGELIVLEGGATIGNPLPGQGSLVASARDDQATIAQIVEGGWEIALPVIGRDSSAVVDIFVTTAELTEGVTTAWLLLGALGVVLVGAAVFVADRLGANLVRPIEDLAVSAHALAEGDLDVRVEPQDPAELREMGDAFNHLADRLDHLLAEEREGVADLSHRLRTPLTSLRLEAERLSDPEERDAIVAHADRLERAMDQVISLTRAPGDRRLTECDLNAVVGGRAEFWRVLADESGRSMEVVLGDGVGLVQLGADEVTVVVDTLVDNVFAHTPGGVGMTVTTGLGPDGPWLEVADGGPGFRGHTPGRGVSPGGSTGLGLDIVRKAAVATGGGLRVDDRPGGGAVVHVGFGSGSV